MASKNLYISIIFRVVILTATSIIFSFFILKNQWDYAIYIGILIFIQTIIFVNFLNKVNRKIAYFFNAIQNEDSSVHFPEKINNKSIRELNKSLNRVNSLIQKVKIENLNQEQYYQTILENASIGIITLNEKGHIILANATAKKLLNYEHLTHIDQLKRVDQKLFTLISKLKPFEQKLIQLVNERESTELTIKASPIIIDGESLLLILIQNIRNELDSKEADSWMRLIQVLTHEIMNTIAPITSLSDTLSGYLKKEDRIISPSEIDNDTIENAVKGLEVINNQGNDLINFVSSYRSLTKIPIPDKKSILLSTLFEKVRILVSQEKGFNKIRFELKVSSKSLEVYADEKQLIQVLVNLTKNAIQSLNSTSNGRITIQGEKNNTGNIIISVNDNGSGITSDLLDQIFIPFFTTRDQGTGIGLSLSKQIMRVHGGTLKVKSTPNEKTVFILEF